MLKSKLLAATAALTICVSANAATIELQCEAPRTLVGEDVNDTNPVTATAVGYSWDDHAWRVFHQLRSGAIVSRQSQYGMTDTSKAGVKTQWQGRLLRQPWLFMTGEIKKSGDDFEYHEWMFDSKQGNRLVMQSINRCTRRAPAERLPSPTAQLPTQPYAQTVPLPVTKPTEPYHAPQTPAPTQQPPAPGTASHGRRWPGVRSSRRWPRTPGPVP